MSPSRPLLALALAPLFFASAALADSCDPTLGCYDNGDGPRTASTFYVLDNSWFALDENNDGAISDSEKNGIAPLNDQGYPWLGFAAETKPQASHSGAPTTADHDGFGLKPVNYLGNTGTFYLASNASINLTNGRFDLSGWTFAWNGATPGALGSGAWNPSNCATLGCSGLAFADGYGLTRGPLPNGPQPGDSRYTIDYTATFAGGPFDGMRYYLHLEGGLDCLETGCYNAPIPAVPEPSTALLFAPALAAVFGAARWRRKRAASAL